MFYQNMPLYLQLIDLLKIEAQTGGNNCIEKKKIINEIAQKFDSLKLRIRFLTELKQISLHQTTHLSRKNLGK